MEPADDGAPHQSIEAILPAQDAAEQRLAPIQSDTERARAFAQQARAANTKRAYRADWTDFTAWCDSREVSPLPARTKTVALYVAARSDELALATLRRRLAAINQAHVARDYDKPALTTEEPLHSVWAGIVREKSRKQDKAAPILIEDLRAIVRSTRDLDNEMLGLRDRALLLVGWAGALRRSEIAALQMQDVRVGPDGLAVTVRRSKTDQEGEGHTIGIPHGERPDTCPIRALQAWASGAEIGTEARTDAVPLFRSVDRWGNVSDDGLSTDGVRRIVQKACKRAGLDASLYSGHSLRAGFITQAARAGKPERIIMRHSGHSDLQTLRGYIREGGLFRDNAAEGIGL